MYTQPPNLVTPLAHQAFTDLSGPQATLFVMSPSVIPHQVVRPFSYNFTPEVVGDINDPHRMKAFLGGNMNAMSNAMKRAVLPDSQGIMLDTQRLSDRWTFILVISGSTAGMSAGAGRPKRTVAVGYCIDEPVNLQTMWQSEPTPNPNATLVFTNSSSHQLQANIGPYQPAHNNIVPLQNVDVVEVATGQLFADNMFVNTPGDIGRQNILGVNEWGQLTTTQAPGAICVNTFHDEPGRIPTRLRSPVAHMQDIVKAVGEARFVVDHPTQDSAMTGLAHNNPAQHYSDVLTQNLCSATSANGPMAYGHVDTTRHMTLYDLGLHFPNLTVVPIKIPGAPNWDIRDQREISPETIGASVVSNTILFAMQSLGISSVAFRFNSWMGSQMAVTPELWEIYQFARIIPALTDNEMEGAVYGFQKMLEMQLFPILKELGGEFNLQVHADVANDTLVDLVFLDRMSYQADMAFIDVNNRLGGCISPLIATENVIRANADNLQTLVGSTYSAAAPGDLAFHQPPSHSSSVQFNMATAHTFSPY